MAVNVRVTGPELLVEGNRRALLRIEESIRQYSAHSRESIYLVRRPLDHSADHVALLWAHGLALIEMVPFGGVIRGSKTGFWQSEEPGDEPIPRPLQMRARRERRGTTFPNPYLALAGMRHELSNVLRGTNPNIGSEVAIEEYPVAGIALFTVDEPALHIEPLNDSLFSTQTIEEALARSIMHRPNLLRASETPSALYSNEDLERMSALLEHSAEQWEQIRKSRVVQEPTRTELIHPAPPEHRRHSPYWLILFLIAMAAFIYIMFRVVLIKSGTTPEAPTQQIIKHTPSEIIIHSPIETELFISPFQFHSRQQLDQALTYGEGIRFLPDTQMIVVMDSLALARGVYGYFNVEETWRKGMLLQTLKHRDTIQIVKFLDPLPYQPKG